MKRILIFSTAYFPFIGGAEIAVKELIDRIGGTADNISGYDFDMITAELNRRLPSTEKIGNINLHRLGLGWPEFDKYWLAFYGRFYAGRLHKQNKYDAIWGIMASYGGFAAMFFKKKFNLPFLLTLQEGDDFDHISKRVGFLKSWFKKIFSSADIVQCISHYLAAWAKANGASGRVEVIGNGVDLNLFTRVLADPKSTELKKAIGKKDGDVLIIHTGRLVKKNALDNIVKALSYLPPNFKFLSVGSGPELKKLKLLAEELNLSNRLIFIEYVSHDKMIKYLKISDIFVRPSRSEGLGNSFLEAMAAGLPVIATPVGGIPDFLKDNETGLFCKVDDPKDLALKIMSLRENNDLAQKIKENGLRLVQAEYNWETISQKFRLIFNQLVA